MSCILALKSNEQSAIQKELQRTQNSIRQYSSLVINLRYKVALIKDNYEQIINHFSNNDDFSHIKQLSIVIEGQNQIKEEELSQIRVLISKFQGLEALNLKAWKNCGLDGEGVQKIIESGLIIPKLQKLIFCIEENNSILNTNNFSSALSNATNLTTLDVQQINLNFILEEYRILLFKEIGKLTQLQNLSISYTFSQTEETCNLICQSLKKLINMRQFSVRIIQQGGAVFNEYLYQSISQGMTELTRLTIIFDSHYIHLYSQDEYFQKMNKLTYLKVQVDNQNRTSFKQVGEMIECISKMQNLIDLDMHIVTSDYNFLENDFQKIDSLTYIRSFKLRLEMDSFYHEELFILFLQRIFSIQSLQVFEMNSKACLLLKKPEFYCRYPFILSLMYTNGTDIIDLIDEFHYFRSNKQLIMTIILFRKYLSPLMLTNPDQIIFDLYF